MLSEKGSFSDQVHYRVSLVHLQVIDTAPGHGAIIHSHTAVPLRLAPGTLGEHLLAGQRLQAEVLPLESPSVLMRSPTFCDKGSQGGEPSGSVSGAEIRWCFGYPAQGTRSQGSLVPGCWVSLFCGAEPTLTDGVCICRGSPC